MAKRDVVTTSSSRSKFIERVLEAIARLAERSGSSAKDILGWLLSQAKPPGRNATVQVQQALRQAVLAGLVRLRGGRYKIRCPAAPPLRPPPPPPPAKNTTDDKRKKSKDPQRRRSKRDKKGPETRSSSSTAKQPPSLKRSSTSTTTAKKTKKTKPRPPK